MLTAARALVGPPHVRRNGVAGGCGHLQRRRHQDLLGEEIGRSNSGRHQKQVVSRAAEGAVTPAPRAATYKEGVEGDAGLWIRYSRKRKKQERGSSEAEEEEGCEKGETETEAEKGDDVGPAIGCPPPRLICSDCGASQTPLWRRGPAGPKSLCNACGIRYRKAKRRAGRDFPNIAAPAPAPGAAGGGGQKGDLRASLDMSVFSQLTAGAEEARRKQREGRLERRQKRREDVLWRLLEESTKLELPCGKEAVEAAVLLMAMSSGLFVSSC